MIFIRTYNLFIFGYRTKHGYVNIDQADAEEGLKGDFSRQREFIGSAKTVEGVGGDRLVFPGPGSGE